LSMFEHEYAYKVAVMLSSKPRFTGTPGEEEARRLIVSELEKSGYSPKMEEFSTKVYEVNNVDLRVREPFNEEIPASPLGFSGETSGVEADLHYIENSDRVLIPGSGNWIGLAVGRPPAEQWKFLAKRASGLIIAEGTPYRSLSHVAVPWEWREKFGSLPAVYVSYWNAVRLLKAKKVHLVLEQEYRDVNSYNIIAEKSGSKYPEDVILVTAHYDSVKNVPGATDNAGGTALVVALASALSKLDLKRTIRFVLFSGEELGLRGSLAYVEKHKDELKNISLVVNLDVHGGVLGSSASIVSGSKSLRNYVEAKAKEIGVNLSVSEDVMSSDSTSFVWKGVPAVNFFRSSGSGADIHTEKDSLEHLHPIAFQLIGHLVFKFIVDIANSEDLPYEKEVPEEIKKKADEYFKKRLALVD